MSKEIRIELTEDEAWVLFEFTRRISDSEKLTILDQAEERALWNLCCIFEKSMHQPADTIYEEFITRCRERLRDE